MRNNLLISGLNFDICWKDKEKNFHTIEDQFRPLSADLLVLPEMFSTGFYMKAAEIADQKEETLRWMISFAAKRKFAVCGSAAVLDSGRFVNRFYFVKPDGTYSSYDKRHLFSYSREDHSYSKGKERVIVEYKGWRFLLQVCYDLRFPVFSRNQDDYDAVLYVANWPQSRIDAWNTLLKARAIENQSYVFGVNRIGTDGNNLNYPESSYCFFADGSIISKTENNIVSAVFSAEDLKKYRERFQFLGDRDSFTIF